MVIARVKKVGGSSVHVHSSTNFEPTVYIQSQSSIHNISTRP